ncbi:MFS transporter [Dictyoglomus thermophilum]|uniref:MFS transporter n=1 Tax=Dictyoglomus thermophilum TaxID=14 RepID=UPI0016541DBB|nr:MFS transporter [Dictyoglomus thermophilum]
MSVDYSEWKFGINNAGFLGSISNFTQILSTAIGNGIIGWLLNYVKYEPNVTQTNSTLTGLKLTISIIPAIIFALGLVIHLWDLDQNKHKKIISDLQIYYEKKNS